MTQDDSYRIRRSGRAERGVHCTTVSPAWSERPTPSRDTSSVSYEKAPRFPKGRERRTGIPKRQGRNRRRRTRGFQGKRPGIFIVLSGFATSDLSVDFCDARQGRSLWKNASGARPFVGLCLLLTCSFRPYPLILWITVLPPLSAPVPLAAAGTTERSESVSEEAEECRKLHFLAYASVRHFTSAMMHFSYNPH